MTDRWPSSSSFVSNSFRLGPALALALVANAATGCAKNAGDAPSYAPGVEAEAQPLGTSAGASMARPTAPPADAARAGAVARDDHRAHAEPSTVSPSLGTAYGEQLASSVVETTFERRSPAHPYAALALHYDDPVGAFAPYPAWSPLVTTRPALARAGGLEVMVIDERGSPLMATTRPDGSLTAVGGVDQRYEIVVTNRTAQRFEVVISVDGLDVIDGSDASYHNDGYVLDPWDSLEIEGWRTSYDQVAAFRFSDIPDSYGARTGRPHNVGVIGVAVFDEAPRRNPPPRPFSPSPRRPRDASPDPFPGNR